MAVKESRLIPLRDKSKYVIPNIITSLSLMLGLISIFYSSKGNYAVASWVILYSAILDKLDGSTARALKASSEFGGQMDSFSDFVAFGIAPAFLVYAVCTSDPAVAVAFQNGETPFFLYFSVVFFILASAMRLARFNITSMPGSPYMIGLATTAAGGLVAGYILTCYAHISSGFFVVLLQGLPYFILILAGLEISNLPMLKVGHKRTQWGKIIDIAGFFFFLFCVITRSFPELLFMAATIYIIASFAHAFKDREGVLAEMKRSGSPALEEVAKADDRTGEEKESPPP